jgi:hypothetical protein
LVQELACQAGTLDEVPSLFRGLLKSALPRLLVTERDVLRERQAVPALPGDQQGVAAVDDAARRLEQALNHFASQFVGRLPLKLNK